MSDTPRTDWLRNELKGVQTDSRYGCALQHMQIMERELAAKERENAALRTAVGKAIDYIKSRFQGEGGYYPPIVHQLAALTNPCNKSGDAPARECSDCGERRTESCGSEDCTFDVEQAHIIRPCPCCGSPAAVQQVERGKDKGAYFIECTNPACALTTNLIFAAMDDPLPILREKWNRRSPPLDSTPDPALKPFDRTHGAAGVPGCSESGTNSVSDSGSVLMPRELLAGHADQLAHALSTVLPMVKGYAAEHRAGRNEEIADWAGAVLQDWIDAGYAPNPLSERRSAPEPETHICERCGTVKPKGEPCIHFDEGARAANRDTNLG